jgi:hypothetical protein
MTDRRRLVADLFFVTQVCAAVVSGVAQFARLLTTTQGVGVSWYAFWDAFLVINLGLAIRANRAQPSRITRQTVATYAVWLVMVTAQIGAMAWGRVGVWDDRDTLTALLAAAGIVAVSGWAAASGVGLLDPYARGGYALCFRVVPQMMLAWRLGIEGNGGFPGLSIIMGHLAILTRIGQVAFSIREAGWDRNRTGSAIAEVGNEVSWCAITIGWFVH